MCGASPWQQSDLALGARDRYECCNTDASARREIAGRAQRRVTRVRSWKRSVVRRKGPIDCSSCDRNRDWPKAYRAVLHEHLARKVKYIVAAYPHQTKVSSHLYL
jgi:hypothetical protein